MEMVGRNMRLATHGMSPSSPTGRKIQPSYQRSIYRAPQASIRREKPVGSHKSGGNARRRRREGSVNKAPQSQAPSPPPPPPPLEVESYNWMDNVPDELGDSNSDRGYQRSPPQSYRRRPLVLPQRAHEDFSETYGEGCDGDESYTANTFYSTDHYYPHHAPPHHSKHHRHHHHNKWYHTLLQFLVLAVLAVLIFDSHSRVRKHKVQLQQYDEERAHILEQMMWIDKAAKKVHNKYAQNNVWNTLGDELLAQKAPKELLTEAQGLRDALKKVQLRVQLNARDRIEQQFGEHPVHVKFTLNPDQDLQIALTDDTPHAASILLEQIKNHLWDTVELQKLSDEPVLQISTNFPATNPVLEFVESSHSCKEVGSVVLRQLEADSMDLSVAVLRVHMQDDTPVRDEDVCIGRVISGMNYLQEVQDDPMVVPVVQQDMKRYHS